jgi:pentatricopeptide repeat protein
MQLRWICGALTKCRPFATIRALSSHNVPELESRVNPALKKLKWTIRDLYKESERIVQEFSSIPIEQIPPKFIRLELNTFPLTEKVFAKDPDRKYRFLCTHLITLMSFSLVRKHVRPAIQAYEAVVKMGLKTPFIRTHNLAVNIYCEMNRFDLALDVLKHIENDELKPNIVTFNTLFKYALSHNQGKTVVDLLLAKVQELKIAPDNAMLTMLINYVFTSGTTFSFENVIQLMRPASVDDIMFSNVLHLCLKKNEYDNAVKVYNLFKSTSTPRNGSAMNWFLGISAKKSNLDLCEELFTTMVAHKIQFTEYSLETLIKAMAAKGRVEMARKASAILNDPQRIYKHRKQ